MIVAVTGRRRRLVLRLVHVVLVNFICSIQHFQFRSFTTLSINCHFRFLSYASNCFLLIICCLHCCSAILFLLVCYLLSLLLVMIRHLCLTLSFVVFVHSLCLSSFVDIFVRNLHLQIIVVADHRLCYHLRLASLFVSCRRKQRRYHYNA
jgi:hypothetical protein